MIEFVENIALWILVIVASIVGTVWGIVAVHRLEGSEGIAEK